MKRPTVDPLNEESLGKLQAGGMVFDVNAIKTHALLEFLVGQDRMDEFNAFFNAVLAEILADAQQELNHMRLRLR